mmetsp:Transcript_58394/g.136795  ORF Transcript_58394/g.136795 Transcript_58394/m.136795 type:complete len:252 (-) Transcript_58394:251-1006(-)
MSSALSLCRAWLEFPTVQSKTVCFFSWSSMIFSSMVLAATKRVARTGRACPMRCALWMAWASAAGFHQGSIRKMWSAACKLSPSPPAFKEISKTLRVGSVWKDTMMLFLETIGMEPNTVAAEIPSRLRRHSISSKKRLNCEKTRALLLGSLACIFWISWRRASTFVLLWNSEVLMFCMMPFLRPNTPGCEPRGFSSSSSRASVIISSSSSSSPSISAWLSAQVIGTKQVGQPTPPLGSCGAWPKYSCRHSR